MKLRAREFGSPRTPLYVRVIGVLCFWLTPTLSCVAPLAISHLPELLEWLNSAFQTSDMVTELIAVIVMLSLINPIGFAVAYFFSPPVAVEDRGRFWFLSAMAGIIVMLGLKYNIRLTNFLYPFTRPIPLPYLVIVISLTTSLALNVILIRLGFLVHFLQRPGVGSHTCPACKYLLRGSPSGRCPECGWSRATAYL